MPKITTTKKTSKKSVNPKPTVKKKPAVTAAAASSTLQLKVALLVVAFLMVVGTVWYVFSAKSNSDTNFGNTAISAASTAAVTHTSDEAVKAAKDLYEAYLPLKAQTVATVGDRTDVEPANVQVMRASEVYFSPALYTQVLGDYMKEYQASGMVTKDEVACVSDTTLTVSSRLTSKTKDSAVVKVDLVAGGDAVLKSIPVTIDLHTLKASKIDCKS